MSKVICNNKDKALYCGKGCKHGTEHDPHVFQSLTDCREKSECCIIERQCKCVPVEMELIGP